MCLKSSHTEHYSISNLQIRNQTLKSVTWLLINKGKLMKTTTPHETIFLSSKNQLLFLLKYQLINHTALHSFSFPVGITIQLTGYLHNYSSEKSTAVYIDYSAICK